MSDEFVPRGSISDGTHYLVSGDLASNKKIVCCVNGIGSHFIFFDKLAKTLVDDGHCVIQYDLLGRGHSSVPSSGKYDGEEHVQQLHHLLTKTLKIEKPVHIVAHSMGGSLATLYTSKYPDKIKSLVLMSPAGLMDAGPMPLLRLLPNFISSLAKKYIEPIKKQERSWRKDFYNHTGVFKERQDEMVFHMHIGSKNPNAFHSIWQSILQFPLYGIEKEVRKVASIEHLHTHLMWGKKDIPIPFTPCFDRWFSILSTGKGKFSSKVLDQTGHAFMLEYPEETNKSVLKFLNSIE